MRVTGWQPSRLVRTAPYPVGVEIEVSPHCLVCGLDPDDDGRCHPDPDRVDKLQWFRDQPSFELRENIGNGHIVAVRRDEPTAESSPER